MHFFFNSGLFRVFGLGFGVFWFWVFFACLRETFIQYIIDQNWMFFKGHRLFRLLQNEYWDEREASTTDKITTNV